MDVATSALVLHLVHLVFEIGIVLLQLFVHLLMSGDGIFNGANACHSRSQKAIIQGGFQAVNGRMKFSQFLVNFQ